MARGRHWLILIPGQGAKLFVYVMLRGQSLHPGGDKEVQVPGAFLGVVKAAAWEPAPRGTTALCDAAPPEGSRRLLGLETASPPQAPRGLVGTWLSRNTPCVQNSGLSVGFFPPDTYTVFFQRQNLIPAVQGTAPSLLSCSCSS